MVVPKFAPKMFSWIQNNQCFLPQLLLVVLSSFSAFLLKYIHKLLGTVWLQASFLLCLLSLPLFPENSRTCFSETVGLVQLLSRVWLFVTHGLQHTRLPCPSPTPGACSNLCPSSWWCHPTISSSVISCPPAFHLSQHQGLFQEVSYSHQVAKLLEFQLQYQSFQWIFRIDFL